jgi:RNA polymerase sigma factor (sigma-70 family)
MPTETFRAVLGRIGGGAATDGQLLTRFIADRDADAFSLLVRRHGPMVFGVCRRMLGDHHAAEDAAQAVFLVLARRANAVNPPEAVGNFLFGVAYRTALEARTAVRRRSARERAVAEMPETAVCDPEFTADLRAVLDAELARLPGKYRALLVACDLEGRPRREVAAAFGLPSGTVCSRLAAARAMLGDRLRKRGLAATSLAVVGAAREASAYVPPRVLNSAARIGRDGAGVVPGPIAALALASRVDCAMTPTKVFFLVVLLVAVSAGLWVAASAAEDPPSAKAPVVLRPAPAPELKPRDPVLLVWRRGHPALYSPDGKLIRELPCEGIADRGGRVALSPDGKRMAYSVPSAEEQGQHRGKVFLRDLDQPGLGTDLGLEGGVADWSRDGKRLLGSATDFEKTREIGVGLHFTNWVYDLTTKKRTVLDVPSTFTLVDDTDGGRRLLFDEVEPTGKCRTWVTAADGTQRIEIAKGDLPHRGLKFSPDGSKILMVCHQQQDSQPASADPLAVYDVKTKTIAVLKIAGMPKFHWVPPGSYQWSPDGKRIAFGWNELHDPAKLPKAAPLPAIGRPGPGGAIPPPPPANLGQPPAQQPALKPFPSNISIVDADGKNMKVILTDEKHYLLREFGWK